MPGILKGILENGLPAGLTSASGAVGGILANRILTASAAGMYVVAFSVHKSAGSLMGVIYMCVADAVWTLSGIYYGEEDVGALRELQRAAIRKGLLFNTAAAGIIFLLSRSVALLFAGKADGETFRLAVEAVRVQALSLPLYMLVYTFKSYLMGIGRKRAANLFSVLSECLVHVFSVFLMVSMLGGRGAWTATPVKLLILLLGAVGYVIFSGRGNSFREKCLLLPSGFIHPENKEMSGSALSMEDVMNVAQASQRFCAENDLDEKTANSLMLCIEEMGAMIIRHGFHDGEMHSIDIRILIRPDKLILRIRDDCRPFDPVECYEMIKDKDSDDKTGMQIILAMSEDIQYMSSVGTNNLMITFGRTRGSTRTSAGGIRHEVRQSLRQAPL